MFACYGEQAELRQLRYGGAIFNEGVSHPFNSLEDDADYDIPVIVYPEDTVF